MGVTLSESTESNIGSAVLTDTGATGGNKVRGALLELTAAVSGVERTVAATLGGAVATVIDYGTSGARIRLKIPHCPYRLFDKLLDQYSDADTDSYSASIATKLLGSGGSETVLTFSALAWESLTPNTDRTGGTMTDVRDVEAVLVSVL